MDSVCGHMDSVDLPSFCSILLEISASFKSESIGITLGPDLLVLHNRIVCIQILVRESFCTLWEALDSEQFKSGGRNHYEAR